MWHSPELLSIVGTIREGHAMLLLLYYDILLQCNTLRLQNMVMQTITVLIWFQSMTKAGRIARPSWHTHDH